MKVLKEELRDIGKNLLDVAETGAGFLNRQKFLSSDPDQQVVLKFVTDTYFRLREGMVLKSKEQEHAFAMDRTRDVLSCALDSWEKVVDLRIRQAQAFHSESNQVKPV